MRPEYDGAYGPYGEPYGSESYGSGSYEGEPYGAEAYGEPYASEAYGGEAHARDAYSGHGRHGRRNDYQAAVDALADPLTDPLPGSRSPEGEHRVPSWSPDAQHGQHGQHGQQGQHGRHAQQEQAGAGEHTSPWFRSGTGQQHAPHEDAGDWQAGAQLQTGGQPAEAHRVGWGGTGPAPGPGPAAQHAPQAGHPQEGLPRQRPRPAARRQVAETAALPVAGAEPEATGSAAGAGTAAEDDDRTVGLRRPSEAELGGRAARRKAAKSHGGRRRAAAGPQGPHTRPGTRLEARRAARAAKDGPIVLLSRAIGEVFITCGVLMLLFVAYQLWWTNVLADREAGGAANDLAEKWQQHPERKPGTFSAGQGFAIMYIPALDVRVPVAQGIDKQEVLDKGMVGHYDEESGLRTAMPWDKKGNFAVAGHRNTHGEPFRYVNKLVAGDEIVVETADTYYVYEMYSRLPSTSPSNVSVVEPVPPQSGFKKPGRYITLTTCTPEFTSKYRLIVWGKMVAERPRSKGKPDALVE